MVVVHLNLVVVVNRPCVAGAVLQTALSLIKERFKKKIESLTEVKPEGGWGSAGCW